MKSFFGEDDLRQKRQKNSATSKAKVHKKAALSDADGRAKEGKNFWVANEKDESWNDEKRARNAHQANYVDNLRPNVKRLPLNSLRLTLPVWQRQPRRANASR